MQCGQGMHFAQGLGCVRDMTSEEMKPQYQQPTMTTRPVAPGMLDQQGQPGMPPNGQMDNNRGFLPQGNWGSEDKEGYNQDREAQFQQMDEQNKQRQLKEMKMGVKGFKGNIKQFQKMVDKATKKNIAIPVTVTQALEKANSIITTVTSATTLESVLDAPMDEMSDIMEVLMEGEQTLRVLQELPKIQKQFTKQLDAINKRLTKAERAAKRAKIVVTNTVLDVKDTIGEVQAAFNDFVTSAQEGGDMEDLYSAMQDVTEPYDTVNEKLNVIEAAAKSKNIVRDTKNKVSEYKREAKKVAPRDEAVSSAISSLQSSADELQSLLKEEFNEEDFFDALETVYDAQDAVIQALTDVTGKEYAQPFNPQPTMQLFQSGPGLFNGTPQGFDSFMGGQQPPMPMNNQPPMGGGQIQESNPQPSP
jgi:methyl-accepting chemotaxis protein